MKKERGYELYRIRRAARMEPPILLRDPTLHHIHPRRLRTLV